MEEDKDLFCGAGKGKMVGGCCDMDYGLWTSLEDIII